MGCDKPQQLSQTPDCKQHLSCADDVIPYNEKIAQYRIKDYNTTDSSQYLESATITIIPVFNRSDSLAFDAKAGQDYFVQIQAHMMDETA